MRRVRAIAGTLAGVLFAAGAAQAQEPPADTVRRATHVCAACHGEDGRSQKPSIPSLAGQTRQYTTAQLKDFRSQIRAEAGPQAYMWGMSALLDDTLIDGLAEFYAAQTPARGRPGNAALLRLGRSVFNEGIPARGVRACASCHGETGEGDEQIPRLAGQHAQYVAAQLKVFRTWLRPHADKMKQEIRSMSPEEMRAVAEYVQSL